MGDKGLIFSEVNSRLTSEANAHTIESAVVDCHLDATRIQGQAYDGTSMCQENIKVVLKLSRGSIPKLIINIHTVALKS